MANKNVLYAVIVVLVVVIIGGFFVFGNKGGKEGTETTTLPSGVTETSVANTAMVDCGQAKDPSCFVGRANSCLPVTVKMMGSDNKTAIGLTVLGVENEKCHFQRKINDVMNLDCLFPKGTNMMNVIDQTFGNDKGLQKVVDDSCANW
jgi:hypothetical protein